MDPGHVSLKKDPLAFSPIHGAILLGGELSIISINIVKLCKMDDSYNVIYFYIYIYIHGHVRSNLFNSCSIDYIQDDARSIRT